MIRSVLLSTCIYCFAFTGLWSLLLVSKGYWWRFPSLLQFAIFSGIIVALAGFVVWPLLRAMRRLGRRTVLAAGALLAVVPMIALTAILWDPGDGDSISGLLRYWIRVPGEFLFGSVPMALATGALAWFATAERRDTDSAPRPEN